MKLETTAGMLKAALDTVGRAIENRNTIPILGTVKFEHDTVETTNLDLSIKTKLPTRDASGATCIPYRPLRALLAHVPQDLAVMIAGGKDGATVSFGTSRYDLPALDVGDFPEIELGEVKALPVDGDGLKKALAFVAPAISTEQTRYYLNGVCLDGAQAVATDGHRMAVHPLGFDAAVFGRGIVTCEAVSTLLALPPIKEMSIAASGLRIAASVGGVSIRAKLIDGTFPDWRRVVPQYEPDAIRMQVDRVALRRLVQRMGSICRGWSVPLVMSWTSDRLALVSQNQECEITAREMIAASASAGGYADINLRYVADMLRSLPGELVTLTVADQHAPTIWRGDGDAYILLMPRRPTRSVVENAAGMLADDVAARPVEVAA